LPVKVKDLQGMIMRLGIVGLPQSGKTTIFNALTRGRHPITTSAGRVDVHSSTVDVPDHRLEKLSDLFKPKKTIFAKVTYADIAGLEGVSSKGGISGVLLNHLSQMDGFVHVVRCFDDDNVLHPLGDVKPQRDIDAMDTELLLNDLIVLERKLERLADERRKGGGRERAVIDREINLFEGLQSTLSKEQALRSIDLSPEEEKIISGFGLLTRKPVLIILNLGEGQPPPEISCPDQKCDSAPLQGKLEMEIAQLPPEEAQIFLGEYGIEEPGYFRLIRKSYELLGLHSFFTIGDDEVRAWTIKKGTTAYEAAGIIHTDLQRGFIRAEVINWDELLILGSLAEARSKGKLRLEGKDYQVNEGEVIQIRFNV
jgi:ribosome-binding ATPase